MPEDPDDAPPALSPDEEETQLMTPPTGGVLPFVEAAPPAREVIGDFEVLEKLGAGGMGAVYRAQQISLGRMVALKVLPGHMVADEESVSRFQREARVAASVSHANVVRVYSSGEADGVHYIAMELIEGEDLGRRLKRGGPLPPVEALRICAEVARGLEHAWRTAHLIHRDIKPANIFLAADGTAKVGDLGLAKSTLGNTTGLTQTGTMLGTPHYISPEQARADREIDFRADIYSLGCTLYQMLTGQVPYSGTDALSIMHQHVSGPLPAILKVWPQCPIPLARLVGKMLKKGKHERPGSYQELIAQIESVWAQLDPAGFAPEAFAPTLLTPEAAVAPHPALTPPPSAVAAPNPPPAKAKLPLYAGVAVLLLALAIGGVFFVLGTKKKPALTKAELYAQQREAEAAARQAAAPAVTAPPSFPATGPWREILGDGTRLELQGDVTQVPEGLRMTGSGAALLRGEPDGRKRDAAVRVRVVGGMITGPRGRQNPAGLYQLYPRTESMVELSRYDSLQRRSVVLGEYGLDDPLSAEREYQLELRAIGSTFTALLDGRVLGTATDDTYREGQFGVGLTPGTATSVLVKSVEILDLDTPAASAPSSAEPWQDLLRVPGALRSSAGARIEEGELRIDSSGFALTPPFSDGAIRMRLAHSEARPPQLRARASEAGTYQAWLLPGGGAVRFDRFHPATKASVMFGDYPLPRAMTIGEEYTLELRAQGQTVTVKVNGEILGAVTDATFSRGEFGAQLPSGWSEGTAVITALDFLHLDAPDGANATSAATPAAATKDAPFVNSLGMKFVPVPITGGPTDGKRVLFSIWETRVQDYEVFATETKQEWPNPNFKAEGPGHPAVNVSWEDATGFCAWLTARERAAGRLGATEVYRLPSDHEWSCAVGIGEREEAAKLPGEKDGKIVDIFPWGAAWPPPEHSGNYWSEELRPLLAAGRHRYITGELPGYQDGAGETAPVGSYPANRLGVHDLGGNALEWCEDWSNQKKEGRVMRGGSWQRDNRGELLAARRLLSGPNARRNDQGFRVVLAPVP